MGFFTGLIIFGIFLFVGFVAYGVLTPNSSLVAKYVDQSGGNTLGILGSVYSGPSGIFALTTGIISIVAGSFIFPNPFLIFGGVFALGLPIIKALGSDVLGPIYSYVDPLIFFGVVTIISIAGVLAWLTYYKGTNMP